MLTDLVLQALVTDAGTISVANGYATDVAAVRIKTIGVEIDTVPSIEIWQDLMEQPPEFVGIRTAIRSQQYAFALHVQSDDWPAKLRAFGDDVSNAWEKPGSVASSVVAAGGRVDKVTVTEIRPPARAPEDINNLRVFALGIVTARISYRRGQL